MQPTAPASALYEEHGRQLGLMHYVGVAKRRALYFLVPFVLVFGIGAMVTAIQKPIYLSEGRILVESQDIPADLVQPTVTDTANQRIQIIQQRIMTRENLLAIVNKFGLFATQRQWMSGTQLLDLMRERTQLQLVELNHANQQANITLALTLSYEYEDPQIAMRVANEFLTLILNEDARTRTNRAAETTKFLAREVKRLEGELDTTDAQILELKRRPSAPSTAPDQISTQLTALKAELVQKSSLYSDSHPEVKALKRKVAALEQLAPKAPAPQTDPVGGGIEELQRQRTSTEKSLEEANRKLSAARLGEMLERDQQSERLQVIEQPATPQKPIRPNRVKLLATSFGLAAMAGFGAVFAAEAFDRSIRSVEQLADIIDSRLISPIPYISTKEELVRKRKRTVVVLVSIVIGLLSVGAALFYVVPSVELSTLLDHSWTDMLRSWLDRLTRLSK